MVGTVERAHRQAWAQTLGRIGMVCYGVVHLVVAYLAVRVALGVGQQEADQTGALAQVAQGGAGVALLWVLGLGLFAFALGQSLMAAVGYRWVQMPKRLRKRLHAAGRAAVGISLGVLAVRLATGGGTGGSGDQKQQELTARLLALPAGRVIVGLVALITLAVGVGSVVSGVRRSFMRDLDAGDLPRGSQVWVRRIGVAGHIAKGVAVAIIGVLLGTAALDADAAEAGGLDTALRTLAAGPFGTALLIAVGLGLAAFGLYCFAAARAHRV